MLHIKIPNIEKVIFNTIIDVRISDINYGNHLGHDSLISFLHEARVRLFNKIGYTELNIEGLGILVTDLHVNYTKEAFYSDRIMINIGVTSITEIRLQLIYEAINKEKNEEIARAFTTIVFYDPKKNKVAKIPQKFLTAINNS